MSGLRQCGPNDLAESREIVIPGYNHLDVLAAARKQNDDRPEPAAKALFEFMADVAPPTAPLRLTRRCTRSGKLRVRVIGDDLAVSAVRFEFGSRTVGRDRSASFQRTISRSRLTRTRAKQLRATVTLRGSNQRVVLKRKLSRCGVR